MNTKVMLVEWDADEIYPSYRLEDLTDNPDLGLVLAKFSEREVVEDQDGRFSARITISKGIYGQRRLRLVAIDADGESSAAFDFDCVLARDLPDTPKNVTVTAYP